ncbi:hypothetical protein N665_0169s0040 [Sinapis alba]|nr:hypothetical protein N665_0169s0040 [Sinapis alba]
MALVQRIPSFSSNFRYRKTNSTKHSPIHYKTQITASSSSSPFTEKHSVERYQRDQWLYMLVLISITVFESKR